MKLEYLIFKEDKDSKIFLAPTVGNIRLQILPGIMVIDSMVLGQLQSLHKRFFLSLPPNTKVYIQEVFKPYGPVEYGEPLFKGVSNLQLDKEIQEEGTSIKNSNSSTSYSIRAPMDGIFYRKPKPESPPFVKEGDPIHLGQTIGLIEVMKTFYPIYVEELPFPEKGWVEKFCVDDGQEIKKGEPILTVQWLET
ncbi:MAG: hypothetical protein D6785_00295 [Planctomycetota bacterium]|nr:MAG: hypothetical protein D6785_00295 [Planctomycetota bacterium]